MKPGLLLLLFWNAVLAQSPWPSESWATATPLTSVMNASGLTELSGLHWNPQTNRLYVVHGDGRLRVLQLDTTTHTFVQIGNKTISGGPEGITQTDFSADQFYTIDENNYEIRQYAHTANFASVTQTRQWNLLQSPSPMQNTGNTGPEGIAFVPDAHLSQIGFTSSVTHMPYTSVKGAGGLFFVAHQDGGFIWVFDVNPEVSNDFAYVGKYQTARSESCDLSFDRSTGLLYILHNTGANFVEVTDMTLAPVSVTRFNTVAEYFTANPTDGNINLEGFAVMPKCGAGITASAFVCRDVEPDESLVRRQDAIRWFEPYVADGICPPLGIARFNPASFTAYPNPVGESLGIDFGSASRRTVLIYNALGQKLSEVQTDAPQLSIPTQQWPSGVYVIEVRSGGEKMVRQLIKP